MKYKTLFRLMLKAVGVMVTVTGLAQLILLLVTLVVDRLGMPMPSSYGYYLIPLCMGTVQVACGIYLFFGGKWIADKAIPGNRPYCPECAYDLTGAVAARCPECGTPFRPEDIRPAMGAD